MVNATWQVVESEWEKRRGSGLAVHMSPPPFNPNDFKSNESAAAIIRHFSWKSDEQNQQHHIRGL